jgi:hypothetical protein
MSSHLLLVFYAGAGQKQNFRCASDPYHKGGHSGHVDRPLMMRDYHLAKFASLFSDDSTFAMPMCIFFMLEISLGQASLTVARAG